MTAGPVRRLIPVAAAPIRVHLGCGQHHVDGWVNADLHATPATDVTFDCQTRWPFPDDSVAEVYASHMLEHLTDPLAFFRELWRCARPGATVTLRLPYGACDAAWSDLTHVRPWFQGSFCMLQPGYAASIGNPQHDAWTTPYAVEAVYIRLHDRVARVARWRLLWRLLKPLLPYLWNAGEELWVSLTVLKTPDAIARQRARWPANSVPAGYAIYAHHDAGRELAPGEAATLVLLP